MQYLLSFSFFSNLFLSSKYVKGIEKKCVNVPFHFQGNLFKISFLLLFYGNKIWFEQYVVRDVLFFPKFHLHRQWHFFIANLGSLTKYLQIFIYLFFVLIYSNLICHSSLLRLCICLWYQCFWSCFFFFSDAAHPGK